MINFNNTNAYNFDGAFRGMRNPLESWHKSDSFYSVNKKKYTVGENDIALAQKLIKGGTEHSKFMRQIMVSVDIQAPIYWWKEFDTYKVGTTANSTSTMHRLTSKRLELSHFANDKLDRDSTDLLLYTINRLNKLREQYVETKDKDTWYQIIQLLPSSYLQTRTVTMNYANVRNMYLQRQNHKLDEWSVGFMRWVDTLPYADELIKYGG